MAGDIAPQFPAGVRQACYSSLSAVGPLSSVWSSLSRSCPAVMDSGSYGTSSSMADTLLIVDKSLERVSATSLFSRLICRMSDVNSER